MKTNTNQIITDTAVLSRIPATINIHMLSRCNMKCGFCHSCFATAGRPLLPETDLLSIIHQIAALPAPVGGRRRKINFVGGEPLLYPRLEKSLSLSRELGLVTSIVTNGWFLNPDCIKRVAPFLNLVGISIDSIDEASNRRIGRCVRGQVLTAADYLARIHALRKAGVPSIKINTVVNSHNIDEDFIPFIRDTRPQRWKLLQCIRMEGENSKHFEKWQVSPEAFGAFVKRHAAIQFPEFNLVPETEADIRGTYAIIAPNGCFLDNVDGTPRYSREILKVGVEAAFAEVSFSEAGFSKRQGYYDAATGNNRR